MFIQSFFIINIVKTVLKIKEDENIFYIIWSNNVLFLDKYSTTYLKSSL